MLSFKRKPKQKPFVETWTLLALLVVWLLTGCATPLQTLPPQPVQGVRVPTLPPSARQQPAPPECLPTCSQRLNTDRESWLNRLTQAAQPGSSAKPSTTPQ